VTRIRPKQLYTRALFHISIQRTSIDDYNDYSSSALPFLHRKDSQLTETTGSMKSNGKNVNSEVQRQLQERGRTQAEAERMGNEVERINQGMDMLKSENTRLGNEFDRQM